MALHCYVVNQVRTTYTTDDIIAKAHIVIMNIKQPGSKNATEYS